MNQTQALHDLAGARSFLFLTVPPIQYTPTVLASGAENAAAEGKAVAQYNAALTERVAAFAKANAGAKVAVVDTTGPFMQAINDPKAYGAADASCFDASGTRCLWWNDVSFFLFFFLVLVFVLIVIVDDDDDSGGYQGRKADIFSSDSIIRDSRFNDLLPRLFRLLWVVGEEGVFCDCRRRKH